MGNADQVPCVRQSMLCLQGSNNVGQLGTGTQNNSLVPVAVAGGKAWSAIESGSGYGCAIEKISQDLYCWGYNEFAQVTADVDSTQDQLSPFKVPGGHRWLAVSTGGYHTTGITDGYEVMSWGNNTFGQMGNGLKAIRSAMVEVDSGGEWGGSIVHLSPPPVTLPPEDPANPGSPQVPTPLLGVVPPPPIQPTEATAGEKMRAAA